MPSSCITSLLSIQVLCMKQFYSHGLASCQNYPAYCSFYGFLSQLQLFVKKDNTMWCVHKIEQTDSFEICTHIIWYHFIRISRSHGTAMNGIEHSATTIGPRNHESTVLSLLSLQLRKGCLQGWERRKSASRSPILSSILCLQAG